MPDPPGDDRQLIELYLAGDSAALRTLDRWVDLVLQEEFRSLRSDWDDLRQEIRSRIVLNLSRGAFNGRSALRTYIHRISRNAAIDFSRRAYRRREVQVDPRDPEASVIASSPGLTGSWLAKDLVDRILPGLSVEDRLLVEYVFEQQLSYQEISRELGIPEGTVKSRVSRCKERLLKLYRGLSPRE